VREGCARKDNHRFGADNILVRRARIGLHLLHRRQDLGRSLDDGLARIVRLGLSLLGGRRDLGLVLDVGLCLDVVLVGRQPFANRRAMVFRWTPYWRARAEMLNSGSFVTVSSLLSISTIEPPPWV
jgi:hypothetical protein